MGSSETILVLAEPDDEPQVQLLRKRLQGVQIIAGNSAAALGEAARKATVLYNCSGKLGLFREISRQCPNLKWVHSRSVGLERTLFPELARSRVVLTNGGECLARRSGNLPSARFCILPKTSGE